MEEFGPGTFGKLNAEVYDELHDPGTTAETVKLITQLAARGTRLIELAIGTGRVALPLHHLGYRIDGLDASREMIAKLRAKPRGEEIPVTISDMAAFDMGARYDFAFLIFNTLFNLTSQTAQVACFRNVARHLNPGGRFMVETYVQDLRGFENGRKVRVSDLRRGAITLEIARLDTVSQQVDFEYIRISRNGFELTPLPTRYALPPEIDLMAQVAGLELEHRWGGWKREPFTGASKMHVSVYRKPHFG